MRLPAHLLEVSDVLLQENGAAEVEAGGPLSLECLVGELGDVVAEAGRRALQEVAVPRRALGVQLELLHPPLLHDDDLDVLPAHVHDDVRVRVIAQG